jgi:hypothetical protein
MKQLRYVTIVLAASFLFAACSKKDDTEPGGSSDDAPILGTWAFVSMTSDKPSSAEVYYEQTPALLSDYTGACATGSTLSLEKGSNTSTGNMLVFDNCKGSNDNGTWILQSSTLTLGGSNFQVLQLDKATLKISHPGGDYGHNTATGYTKDGDITSTFTFKHK